MRKIYQERKKVYNNKEKTKPKFNESIEIIENGEEEELNIESSIYKKEEFQEILTKLQKNTKIKYLNLYDNNLDENITDLAKLLEKNETITNMDLGSSLISKKKNFKLITNSLKNNKTIKTLNLAENNMKENEITSILYENKSITDLEIQSIFNIKIFNSKQSNLLEGNSQSFKNQHHNQKNRYISKQALGYIH
jgi:hypothetical protein